MVYRLTGQGEDPDLCHLAQHVLLVAAQRQHLAPLCGVLHDLGVGGAMGGNGEWEAKEGGGGEKKVEGRN